MSANLEIARSHDDALAARLTGAMAYDGRHPTAQQAAIVIQLQNASDEELRRISELFPQFIIVLAVRNGEDKVVRWHTAFADNDDRTRAEEGMEEESASQTEIGLDKYRLQRVLDYIAANVRSNLTLEKLAAVACYSTFHFARQFKLALGVSPQRYIGRLRLESAMKELGAGKLSLAEIAFNANFSSQASFTRAFHRHTGTTPNEYKRRRSGRTSTVLSARTLEARNHGHL
jgi:transcriptional regulator GlxA family with amidase domain